MGNQAAKLDDGHDHDIGRSAASLFQRGAHLSRRSLSAPDIHAGGKQGKGAGARLSFIRMGGGGRSSMCIVRTHSLTSQLSIRPQNSFSSQSSDMANANGNSNNGASLRNMSSADSLSQSEHADARVSRRNSRRISWRGWQRDTNQAPSTRLVEGRTHVCIGNACALLPSDLLETDSMDRFHYIVKHVLDGNYQGELPRQPRSILDVGSGSGIWMREMAAEFPDSELTGCDIVDLTAGDVLPKSCRWIEANILNGLPFDDNQFDLVHQRQLGFYLPTKRLARTLQELHRVCSPGGQLHLVDMGVRWEPVGHNVAKLQRLLRSGLSIAGIDPNALEQMEPRLRQAGFVDIEPRQIAVPVGAWGGLVGRILADATRHMVESARPVLVRHCKLRSHEVHAIMSAALAEMEINQCCAVLYTYRAKKPFGGIASTSPAPVARTSSAAPSTALPFRWSLASFGRGIGAPAESSRDDGQSAESHDHNHHRTAKRFSTPPGNS